MNLIKNKMMRRHKNFAFYVGIGLITFTAFSYLASPEIASAGTIDIRDQYGRVTTWGWWLINILSPFFVTFEFLKIALGILLLPLAFFGFNGGQELLSAGWSNLTVMWPGLLAWIFGFWCLDKFEEDKSEEDKSKEDE